MDIYKQPGDTYGFYEFLLQGQREMSDRKPFAFDEIGFCFRCHSEEVPITKVLRDETRDELHGECPHCFENNWIRNAQDGIMREIATMLCQGFNLLEKRLLETLSKR